jgi:hypothetical protein
VAIIFLTAVGFGIWKAGDVTGIWNDRALKKASSAWAKQSDYKTEEKAINGTLDGLADALTAGDISKSLTYFHDDVQKEYTALLNENASRLGELADIVRSHQITFLSTTTEYYDESRSATLTAGISQSTSPSPGVVHIVMVKTENGWVVYTLR